MWAVFFVASFKAGRVNFLRFVGDMLDRFKFFAPRVFGAGDKEIGSLAAAHPNGVILTSLTAGDLLGVFFFNTAPFFVGRGVNRFVDNLKPFGRIIPVEVVDPGDNIVGPRFIESRAVAGYKNIIFVFFFGSKNMRQFDIFGVAVEAEPEIIPFDQRAVTVFAFFFRYFL